MERGQKASVQGEVPECSTSMTLSLRYLTDAQVEMLSRQLL